MFLEFDYFQSPLTYPRVLQLHLQELIFANIHTISHSNDDVQMLPLVNVTGLESPFLTNPL